MSPATRIATVGMFDGVHAGHRYLIRQLHDANPYAAKPLVLTFSNHPLSLIAPARAPHLLSTPDEKRAMLESLGVDVKMIEFDSSLRSATALEFIGMLRKHHDVSDILMGFNNHFGSDRPESAETYSEIAASVDVNLRFAKPYPAIVSSSLVRDMISRGEVRLANINLCSRYTLSGRVVGGDHIGRKLGFPTANLEVSFPKKLIPAHGVYAALAEIDNGDTYISVVNIGVRPTVVDAGQLRIEAHLIGCRENLYGRELTLHLIDRLRGEQRFDDLVQLREAIAADIAAAKRLV